MDKGDVIVSGMGVVSSVGTSIDEFSDSLKHSSVGIEDAAFQDHLGALYPAALVKGYDFENALRSIPGLTPNMGNLLRKYVARSDLYVKTAIASAMEAWHQAQLHVSPLDPRRIGLICVSEVSAQQSLISHLAKYSDVPELLSPKVILEILNTDLLGITSDVLGIKGEGFCLSGTSASGNVALIKGWQMVKSGTVDCCVVVGAMTEPSDFFLQSLKNIGVILKDLSISVSEGAAQPFDERCSGFCLGQASGCVILEASDSAIKRNVDPLAKIASGAIFLDANRMTDPSEEGESHVMKEAIDIAGLTPSDIDYVNAHGTGTTLGDEIEVSAIYEVFKKEKNLPKVNSTKSLIGHCLFSAGIVEAIASILQIRGEFLHGNPYLDNAVSGKINFVGKKSEFSKLKHVINNSFGFAGVNSSLIISGVNSGI